MAIRVAPLDDNLDFPEGVQQRQAERLADAGTPEGAAIEQRIKSEIDLTYTPSIGDAVGEWWIHPLATYQESPYPRTVFGAIAANGDVLACEFNHGTGKTSRTICGRAVVDDHNVPSLIAEKGKRPVLAWTNHNADNLIRIKVGSRNGDMGSMAVSPEIVVDIGAGASYTQFHYIPSASTPTATRYWCFTRSGYNNWNLVALTVDELTGGVTTTFNRPLIGGSGRQCYLSTADAHSTGEQVIRCGFGFNPAQADSEIFYFEINAVTGAVSGTRTPSQNAITGASMPVYSTQMTPFVAATPATHDRRFFYTRPGPDVPAVAYADWPLSNPDASVYTVKEAQPADRFTGLIPNGGRAQSASLDALSSQWQAGFTWDVFAKLPDKLGSFKARIGTSSDPIATMEILSDGRRYFRVKTDDTFIQNTSTATPFAPMAGQSMGMRLRVDIAAKKVRQYWTTDNGVTWTEIGTVGSDLPPTSTGVSTVPSVTGMIFEGAADSVARSVLSTLSGTVITSINFEADWPSRTTSYTTAKGVTWAVHDGALIGNSNPAEVTTTFGLSGPRINAEASNNYIAGMAFENPSYDRVVITAHSGGGKETVRKHRASPSGYVAEVIREQPTAKGRLIRPYPPVNAGPIPAMLTEITSYTAFTNYKGNFIST